MYIDVARDKEDNIFSWIRSPSGQLLVTYDKAVHYCYSSEQSGSDESSPPIFNMVGDRVYKHSFNSKSDYETFIKQSNVPVFESDISTVDKFLSDNFYKAQKTTPNIGFFDIETDFDLSKGMGYPTPDNPHGVINAITIYKIHTQTFHILYVSEYPVKINTDEKVEMLQCATESQLLNNFVSTIDDIDLLSGWNSNGYDLPYIMARLKLKFGERKGRQRLCRNGFSARERSKKDNFGNMVTEFDLVGRQHLDMLLTFKKFIPGERPSFSLEAISQVELGYGKIEYDGDLGELYRTDRKTFLEYNLHDVKLLRDLEKKHKLIQLAINMAQRATMRYGEVLGSIKYLERSIRNFAHFDRKTPTVLPDVCKQDDGEFAGGLVIDTQPGVYGWGMSVDLGALYPSTIRALNISPETHIFQLLNRHEDFLKVCEKSNEKLTVLEVVSGEAHLMSGTDVHDLLRAEGLSISANGSIFHNDFVGLIPEILNVWAEERTQAKNKASVCYKQGDGSGGDRFRLEEQTAKLSSNSLYGAVSNPHGRFYSLDLAASVTLTGQEIAKFQANIVDTFIEEYANAA